MRTDKVFHLISNTHWDREWRFPFQRNRQMLVEMIDNVLDILEKEPAYRAFHLDSQSVVLKDYLEIKPHNAERIKKLVLADRLFIGPWYILPDQFLVGGENLIRNLLLGHKVCRKFGKVSKIGYSPFSWGQISQLPQIYRQFGIELIMFYRGINSLDSHNAEFIWEGADGTSSISSRFSTMPRYNFYFYIYRPVIHNEQISQVEYQWSKGGVLFHFASGGLEKEDYFNVDPIDSYFHENVAPSVTAIVNKQADDFTTPHVIWMEGHDSSGPNIKTVRILEDIRKVFPEMKVIHSTLEDYAKAVKESAQTDKLPLVKGERRSAQYDLRSGNLYGYTTSARMYLKQLNFENEKWLQYYAEPFYTLSGILGNDINNRYLEVAWEMLIQNSAHDSIGGCSLDEIHDDMVNRYKQSTEIAKGILEQALKYLVKKVNLAELSLISSEISNGIHLVAFNPSNVPYSGIMKITLDLPEEYKYDSFLLQDSKGKVVESLLLSSETHEPVLEQLIDRPMYLKMKRCLVLLNVDNIPPFGYSSFSVFRGSSLKIKGRNLASLKNGLPVLENSFIKLKFNSNGTFNLTDKKTGGIYRNLGSFLDEGEAGHAWVNKKIGPIVNSLKSKAKFQIIQNTQLQSVVKITLELKIPKRTGTFIKKINARSGKLSIQMLVTLSVNSPRVDLNIRFSNNTLNHRLRILFPTGIETGFHYGEGQFDVVERPIERPDTTNWVEQPMYDFPAHHFIALKDNKRGLAVLNSGLKEYEVYNDKNRTLALTLFRAFTYIIQPSSVEDYSYQKGSQCLGEHDYNLALLPFSSAKNFQDVFNNTSKYYYPPVFVQCGTSKGTLPPENSFFEVTPEIIQVSAIKPSEDGDSWIIRVFNPTMETIEMTLRLPDKITTCSAVTLEETNPIPLEITNGAIKNKINKKEIQTFLIK